MAQLVPVVVLLVQVVLQVVQQAAVPEWAATDQPVVVISPDNQRTED